jgi:hypothetical protein
MGNLSKLSNRFLLPGVLAQESFASFVWTIDKKGFCMLISKRRKPLVLVVFWRKLRNYLHTASIKPLDQDPAIFLLKQEAPVTLFSLSGDADGKGAGLPGE